VTSMQRTLACLALAAASAAAQELMVRNARLITAAGAEMAKADLRIADGKIAEIKESLGPVPPRTPILDAKGRFVTPAFVLAHTSEGLDRPNENMDVTPFVSVLDAIDPTLPFFDSMLRDGVYTIHVMPGDRTLVGGMGRVMRPQGRVVEDMTIVADSGLKISMIPPQGNRAAHVAKLRTTLDEARRGLETKEFATETKPSGNFAVDLETLQIERRKQSLVALLKRRIPAYVTCETAGDVVRALDVAKEFGLDVRLILMAGTWRAASLVAESKVKVILAPEFFSEEPDPETGKPVRRFLPKILHDAGVEFATTSAQTSLGQRYLWYQAATLVRHGVPRDVALRSVTATAAKILGLEASKGSLETGKDADLLILTDDPLSGRAWVDTGVSEGKIVYERVKDRRLKDLLGLDRENG
jgi:imidazolonepropionase-like amidohydrolase